MPATPDHSPGRLDGTASGPPPKDSPRGRAIDTLAASNLATQSAEELSLAAAAIVAVLLLGTGPGELGALATAQTLPVLLLSGAAATLPLRLHEPLRTPAAPCHPLLALRDGTQLVGHHALLRPIPLTAVAWNIAWFVLQAAYVAYAIRALGLSAAGVGLTPARYGTAMVAGALLAPRIAARLSFGHAILLGPLVSVAAMCAMAATLRWPQGLLAGVSFLHFGFGPIVWTITLTMLRQR